MEELLRKLRVQAPAQGLREQVLRAAREELAKGRAEQDWLDRILRSRVFWYSSAATTAVCLTAILLASGGTAPLPVVLPATKPAASALAQELARALGDGHALESQFAAQLSGTADFDRGSAISQADLLRSMQ
jgi:hypothetical protein